MMAQLLPAFHAQQPGRIRPIADLDRLVDALSMTSWNQYLQAFRVTFVTIALVACESSKQAVVPLPEYDLKMCTVPDGSGSYIVDQGDDCWGANTLASPCYKPDGSVFAVRLGEAGYSTACLQAGGSTTPPVRK